MRRVALALLLGCTSQPAPSPTAPPPPPSSSAAAPAPAPAPSPATPKFVFPEPLTDDEKKELRTTCKPLLEEYSKRTSVTKDRMMISMQVRVIERLVDKPPAGLAPSCVPLFERSARGEIIERLDHDARSTLERTAANMKQVYEKEKQLRLVPAGSASVEIVSKSREGGMIVIATATPFHDGKNIEWTMDASIKDGAPVFGPIAIVK